MRRLAQACKFLHHIIAVARTTADPVKGDAVATNGYGGVLAICNLEAIGASATADFKLQESDTTTDGDFTDITGAAAVQFGATDDNKTALLDVLPRKKYIRAVHTPGGAGVANGVTGGVTLVLYRPAIEPVVNTPAAVVV